MARTTRSKATGASAANKKSSATQSASTSRYTLPEPSTNPHKLFVLPKAASPEARVVSLLNPRHARPCRYLVCPDTGFYEFKAVAAPSSAPRSWLVQRPAAGDTTTAATTVTRNPVLYVATPIDPLFLVLPAFAAHSAAHQKDSNKGEGKQRLFLAPEDYLDLIRDTSPHLHDVLHRWPTARARVESRMAAVCDTVEAAGERMMRPNEGKALAELLTKARAVVASGSLPPSLEARFVAKALEAPVLGVKRPPPPPPHAAATTAADEDEATEAADGPSSQSDDAGTATPTTSSDASQSSAATTASTAATSEAADADAEEAAELLVGEAAPPEVVALQRLRTALDLILSSYVAPAQAAALKAQLASTPAPSVDFAPLDAHLAHLARQRAEAAAARSAGDFSSRKRGGIEDEEEAAERAQKRQRREEEEKRKKASESRGVRDLKKVNVAGMKKMSDFFKKKA